MTHEQVAEATDAAIAAATAHLLKRRQPIARPGERREGRPLQRITVERNDQTVRGERAEDAQRLFCSYEETWRAEHQGQKVLDLSAVQRPGRRHPSLITEMIVGFMDDSPLDLLEAALAILGEVVVLEEVAGPSSHTAIVATGLDDARVGTAVGRYLVGVIGGAIQHDARLSAALLPSGDVGRADVRAAVENAIGTDNLFVTDAEIKFRDRERNAWIGEGVAHALLVVRSRVETCCLAGPVRAISKPHDLPSMPGLDAVAVYEVSGDPFVAIGESKATRERGLDEMRKAAHMFAKIDQARYGSALRSELGTLRQVLPPTLKDRVTDSLWRDAPCYVPVIVHGDAFDHGAERTWLASLSPPADRVRVLVIALPEFHGFFDAVADAMRAAVEEIVV